MRLATVFDKEANEPRPVFELPGGRRVELRELFRPDGGETLSDDALGEIPLFFTDLAKTVEFLDDVTDAIRQWSRERAESWQDLHAARAAIEVAGPGATRVDLMPFLPPVPIVRAFREFDAFEQHARSWRARLGLAFPQAWKDSPAFSFGNAGSLIGHDAVLHAPTACRELDYGLQIAAIIGRGGCDIRVQDAWSHIAGFTIVNAFVARDVERREQTSGLALGGRGKSRDFGTAVGPYLVSTSTLRDRIDSEDRLRLTMRAMVNGNEVSRADASAMFFSWPELVAHASRDAELFPGDLLAGGVVNSGSILDCAGSAVSGAEGSTARPVYLQPGDVVELEVERLGLLRTPIIARSTNGNPMVSGADRADSPEEPALSV